MVNFKYFFCQTVDILKVLIRFGPQCGYTEFIYSFWRQNPKFLNSQFLAVLPSLFDDELKRYGEDAHPLLSQLMFLFGWLILEFPDGDPSLNKELAILCFQLSLKICPREQLPFEWALICSELGNAYYQRIQGNRSDNQEEAIRCFQLVLEVCTSHHHPLIWGFTQEGLGTLFLERIQGQWKDNLDKAIHCLELAQQVYTLEDCPAIWERLQLKLSAVYLTRWYHLNCDHQGAQEQVMPASKEVLDNFFYAPVDNDLANLKQQLEHLYRLESD